MVEPALAEFGHTLGFSDFNTGVRKNLAVFLGFPSEFGDLFNFCFKAKLRKWKMGEAN